MAPRRTRNIVTYRNSPRYRPTMKLIKYVGKAPAWGSNKIIGNPSHRKYVLAGGSKPIWVKKTFQADNVVAHGNSTMSGYFLQFAPNSLPGWSNYQTLFNLFFFKKIKVTITPTSDNTILSAQTFFNQSVHSSIEYVDPTVPSTVVGIINDQSYKRTKSLKDHVRTLYPKVPMDINTSIVDTDTTTVNKWMHTDNSFDMLYNGLRLLLDPIASGGIDLNFNVYVEYTIGFKDSKI